MELRPYQREAVRDIATGSKDSKDSPAYLATDKPLPKRILAIGSGSTGTVLAVLRAMQVGR